MGGMSGLNTLSSQSFGAGNYLRLGVLMQRTILMCACLLLPIGIAWFTCTSEHDAASSIECPGQTGRQTLHGLTTVLPPTPPGTVLQAIGIEPAQAEMSAQFARVYFFVLPAMLTVQAIQTFFRSCVQHSLHSPVLQVLHRLKQQTPALVRHAAVCQFRPYLADIDMALPTRTYAGNVS
jgi:hypothetical protein